MSRGTLDPAASYCFRVRDFHPLWSDFPDNSTNKSVHFCSPQPRYARITVWALPLSLAATYGIDVSFSSSPYLDVSVQAVPDVTLWIHVTTTEVFSARFPHSDISGSMDICSSPKLFAAYHVFHRLLVPRHPPCALISLTNSLSKRTAYGASHQVRLYSVTNVGFRLFVLQTFIFLGCLVSFVLKILYLFLYAIFKVQLF